MNRQNTFTWVVSCVILLTAVQRVAAQQMDFSNVPSALTVSDTERYFAQRAAVVNAFNACRLPMPSDPFKNELGFTTIAIAKLEYGGKCPNAKPGQDNVSDVVSALGNVQVRDDWHLGTDFPLVRNGEMDVAARGLVTILYRYRDILYRYHHRIGQQVYDGQLVYEQIRNDFLARVVSGPPPDQQWYDWSLKGVGIPETENHILNIETSRYLTNQLLGIDNERNGFNRWMLVRLRQLLQNDFSEYNARPYQHYSMMALENLYDFAQDPRVKLAAQMVLDYVSAKFAVSSNGLRRAVPFRRLRDHIDNPMFDGDGDHQTMRFMMLAGITHPQALPAGNNRSASGAYVGTAGQDDMQLAAVTTYRVPDLILDLILSPGRNTYFQRIRGSESTTAQPRAAGVELYSRSAPFLISAGGYWQVSPHSDRFGDELFCFQDVGWPLATMLVPNSDGTQYGDFIRIEGDTTVDTVRSELGAIVGGAALGSALGLILPTGSPFGGILGGIGGTQGECKVPYRHRINTCVGPGFACGLQPVIPASYQNCRVDETDAHGGHWTFIDASENSSCRRSPGFCAEVYSGSWQIGPALQAPFGFFDAAPSRQGSCGWFHDAVKQNFSRTFQPAGVNEYVTALGHRIQFVPVTGNQYKWGVVSVDGRSYDTNIGDWPLAEGDIINSCEHNPCQAGDGHNGYITIDNPVWGKRLILDMHDPMNPVRTEIDLKSQTSGGAVARTPNHLDVLWVGKDGSITSTGHDDSASSTPWNTLAVSPPNTARLIAANSTPVASVTRLPGHVEAFWLGADGSIGANWSDATVKNGAWNQPFSIAPPNSARWNSPVVAVARYPSHLDVFWIAPDGSISTAVWDSALNNGRWNAPSRIAPPNSAGPEAGIAAVARTPLHLDVFWVAGDGSVASNFLDANFNHGQWNNPYPIAPPNAARLNSPVVAVARTPNHVEVFWIDYGSGISNIWWDVNPGQWSPPFLIAPVGSASIASGLSVLTRLRDHVEVFWVAGDGSVGSAWWDAGYKNGQWTPPYSLAPPGSAVVTSPVYAVARTPDHVDVFWVGRDGAITGDSWDVFAKNVRWTNPFTASNPGVAAVARLESSNDYAATRTPDHLDVFWTVGDGEVFTNWWDGKKNNGRWNQVSSLFTLPADPNQKRNLNSTETQGNPASLSGGTNPVGVGGKFRGLTPPGQKPAGQNQGGQNQAGSPELSELARPNTPVAAVARTPDHLDVFWIGQQGQIWSERGDANINNFWATKFDAITPPGAASPASGLTALARRPDLLDVFWIGGDGGVWSTSYNGRWNAPFSINPPTQANAGKPAPTSPLLDRTARPDSPLAAVARTPESLDVFWISKEGQIWSNGLDGQVHVGAWNVPININVAPPNSATAPSASPGSGLAAVARTPDHLDVFWIGSDGQIWSNWRDRWVNGAHWNAPSSVSQTGTGGRSTGIKNIEGGGQGVRSTGGVIRGLQEPDWTARPDSPVVAAARTPEHLDVFWIGKDGAVWSTWWDARLNGGAWIGPYQVSGAGAAAPNALLSVVARTPQHLDVFWTAPDVSVMSNWWDAFLNGGKWNAPYRVWP